jgi:hypothetical protein
MATVERPLLAAPERGPAFDATGFGLLFAAAHQGLAVSQCPRES